MNLKVGRQVTGYYADALKAGAKSEDIQTFTASENQKIPDPAK